MNDFCLKQGSEMNDFCLTRGQGLKGSATHQYPNFPSPKADISAIKPK